MGILDVIFNTVKGAVETFFPSEKDKSKREELLLEIQREVLARSAEIEKAAADVVKTEAASTHFLAANWRPITMLVFLMLIVARFFGYQAPGMTEDEYIALWDLMKIGIGGYIASRGLEKIGSSIGQGLGKK